MAGRVVADEVLVTGIKGEGMGGLNGAGGRHAKNSSRQRAFIAFGGRHVSGVWAAEP